MSDHLP